MPQMGKFFGTDGVRGIANKELTAELALALGRSAGYLLQRGKPRSRVVVGRDPRASGDLLTSALMAGLSASGVEVTFVGVVPTPAIAFLVCYLGAQAGVVVTASHNPAEENGIKFFGADGFKLPDELEEEIEALLPQSATLPAPIGAEVGRIQQREDLVHHYLQGIRRCLPYRLEGLRIVVDCANGSTAGLAEELLSDLGAEVIPLACQPDGLNINVHCGSLHPERMMAEVLQQKANLGVAFDGDGDRALLADEEGKLVDGDRILAFCALHWAEQGRLPGKVVVATVMSNLGLELALRQRGIRLLRTSVGDRYVSEEMRRVGAILGGEKSGHIIFAEASTTGDGLITLLKVLEVMYETGTPLSALARQMEELPQLLVNVPVKRKEGWDQNPEVQKALKEAERRLGDRGRIVVRPSGTEKVLRVMAEGPDAHEIEEIVVELQQAIERWSHSSLT